MAFTQNYDNQGNFKIGFELDMPEGYTLHFDEVFAELAGFEEIYSSNGTFEGKHVMSDTKLQSKRAQMNSIAFTIVKYEKIEVNLEATEDRSLDSVAEVANAAFENHETNANIVFGECEAVIRVKDKYLMIELPRSINIALGFSSTFRYKTEKLNRTSREHILLILYQTDSTVQR